ncbi:uncharacterized protein BcabD6B2_41210 [Babesia caballi]|uniref:Uncharacterized protein n=1 Tax=Babesia caballi TaxID=5871 RepID=A0AAV4LXY4_BABCB|nr:hypothetical protein BcabD6B2_41210 [Babesia caballi]
MCLLPLEAVCSHVSGLGGVVVHGVYEEQVVPGRLRARHSPTRATYPQNVLALVLPHELPRRQPGGRVRVRSPAPAAHAAYYAGAMQPLVVVYPRERRFRCPDRAYAPFVQRDRQMQQVEKVHGPDRDVTANQSRQPGHVVLALRDEKLLAGVARRLLRSQVQAVLQKGHPQQHHLLAVLQSVRPPPGSRLPPPSCCSAS